MKSQIKIIFTITQKTKKNVTNLISKELGSWARYLFNYLINLNFKRKSN